MVSVAIDRTEKKYHPHVVHPEKEKNQQNPTQNVHPKMRRRQERPQLWPLVLPLLWGWGGSLPGRR